MKLYDRKNPLIMGLNSLIYNQELIIKYLILIIRIMLLYILALTNLLFAKYELVWIMSRETVIGKEMMEQLTNRI